ncbi:MAG: hypothetical protein GF308_06690 [Candidatus Heimdallarchaeota archaeon]|nr:hypothetical protein [Candidatus Heimdallarchaeota archaeon]
MRCRNFGKILGLVILFASLFLVSIQPAVAAEEDYTWYGYIKDGGTGYTISGLTVELWFEEAFSGTKFRADTTTTNSQGYYCVTGTIDESEPGYWTAFLKLMKDGYITAYVECGHVPLSHSTGRFDYTEMIEIGPFDCSFHGYVKNKFTGAKVAGARVRLKNSAGTIVASTITNSNGYYSFEVSCEGGELYYIQAFKLGLYSDWETIDPYLYGNIYTLLYLEEGIVR